MGGVMLPGLHIGTESIGGEPKLEGYSRLLHLLACRERMFMALASHAGPEGDASKSEGWAVAGVLASQHAWEDFGRRWTAALARDPAQCGLPGLIRELKITCIGAVLSAAGRGSRRAGSRSAYFPRRIPDPGLLCFEHCVLEAARRMQSAPAGETVFFLMDWSEPLASSALWHLEDLMNFSASPVRERLGALGFESSRDFPPLQAARWFAENIYETLPGVVRQKRPAVALDADWLDCATLDSNTSARTDAVMHFK